MRIRLGAYTYAARQSAGAHVSDLLMNMDVVDRKQYRVFVSYRRSDSWGWAGRIYDRLREAFGEDKVFMDVEGLEAGVDFRSMVLEIIAGSDVTMVVIGRGWVAATGEDGRRRLEDENDLVRCEISRGLACGVRVLPLLVDDASMPSPEELPEGIASLAALNAVAVRPGTFRRDVDRLCETVRAILERADKQRARTPEQELKELEEERDRIDRRVNELRDTIRADIQRADDEFEAEVAAGRPMVDPKGVAEQPYDAFLVYGHARDRELAMMLQRGLQQFARPWHQPRSLRVFRDQADLAATPDLWGAIAGAVDKSKYLVYLASPESANSAWVDRELRYWLSRRSVGQLLIVRTGGTIAWDSMQNDFDWAKTTALAPALQGWFGSEPLSVDLAWLQPGDPISLRDARFRDAVATLSAALHGVPKSELLETDSAQSRQKRLVTVAALTTLILMALLALAAAFVR